jgi:hypothetical protein
MRGAALRQWAWPLRTSLACAIASLVHLSPRCAAADSLLPGRLFAAICAVVACCSSLGGTLRAATQVSCGAAAGGALAAAAFAAVGTSSGAAYGVLVLGSLVILLPAAPPPSAKLAWAVLVGSATTADADARAGLAWDATLPLKLALVSVLGAAAAVLASAPPWPRSRAAAEASAALSRAGAGAAAATAALALALAPAGEARRGALCARAEAALSSASSARDAAAAALADAAWEPRGAGAAQLARTLRRMDALLLYASGMALATASVRGADSSKAELGARLRRADAAPVQPGGGDVAALAAALAARHAEVLARTSAHAAALDAAAAAPAAALADTAAAAVRLHVPGGSRDSDVQDVRSALLAASTAFDEAVTAARVALFYAPSPPPAQQAANEAALAVHGPPVARYAALFCLQAFASEAAAPLDDDAVTSSPRSLDAESKPPDAAPGTLCARLRRALRFCGLPPDGARWAYALKLTAAAVAAMAAGAALCGSGLWAALAVAFIGPRERAAAAGGSFRAAALRAGGTALGALAGYGIAAASGGVGENPLLALALLALWVALLGPARRSPAHAYGIAVAMFTPYVTADVPSWRAQPASAINAGDIDVDARNWAYRRIEQNVVGALIFAAVELCVAPRRAAAALRGELAAGLRTAAKAAAQSAGGAACAACAPRDHVAALREGLARQRALLAEAADEPPWPHLRMPACFSTAQHLGSDAPAASLPPLPLRAAAAAEALQARLLQLLQLHQTLAVAAAEAAAATDAADGARLIAPAAPALRQLLLRLRDRFEALRRDVLSIRSSLDRAASTSFAPSAAAAAAAVAAAAGEAQATLGAAFIGLLRSHRDAHASVVPTRLILAFHALVWAARALARHADALADGIAAALAEEHRGREDGADDEAMAAPPAEAAAAEEDDAFCVFCGAALKRQDE